MPEYSGHMPDYLPNPGRHASAPSGINSLTFLQFYFAPIFGARICKRLRSPQIDSASLCSLEVRYDNPICRTGRPGYTVTKAGGIDASESIPGLLKRLQIRDLFWY
jgi:hypothetical protein